MYRVLLVEDDAALRFMCSQMKEWKEYGLVVAAEAANGKEALEILKTQDFDLIMTDIRMPFMDGLELLEQLQNMKYPALTVLISSYDEFEYARKGMILGCQDFLVKPIKGQKLKDLLSRISSRLKERAGESGENPLLGQVLKTLGVEADKNSFLYRLCDYLTRHIEENVTMEDAAEYMNLSKDYLGKTVKQNCGKTFPALYSFMKIEYARQLLETGSYKAYEISEILGYSSPDYFTKVFKEHTGTTPSMYKKQKEN